MVATEKQEKDISRQLRPARVIIPLIIGLAASIFLLINNLREVRFEKVTDGSGAYQWIDENNNGKVDFDDADDFAPSENGDYKKLTYTEVLKEINWTYQTVFWLFMAFVMMFLRDFGYMLRIRILTDKFLSWRQSFRVIMIWEFASALTPGVVGGAAVAMFILNREKVALGKSTAIVMITAILDNLFYLIMVPMVLVVVGSSELFPLDENKEIMGINLDIVSLFWVAYSIVFFFFAFLLAGIFISPKLIKNTLVGIFSLPMLRTWKEGARKTGDEILVTSKEMRTQPITYWLKAFGATALSWTGRFLVVNCLIMAFISTGLLEHVMIYARQLGMWVIMIISPTPGGSGIAEYAFTGFLSDFVPFGMIGILAILWRLISYYPYLFIGSVILPRWMRSTKPTKTEVNNNL
jgi:uncharacterized protein (TIRG00374 family)